MMGQQTTASTTLRRMILVLAAAALMAAIMVVSATPAVAKNSGPPVRSGLPSGPPTDSGGGPKTDGNKTDVVHCQAFGGTGVFVNGPVHDSGHGTC